MDGEKGEGGTGGREVEGRGMGEEAGGGVGTSASAAVRVYIGIRVYSSRIC